MCRLCTANPSWAHCLSCKHLGAPKPDSFVHPYMVLRTSEIAPPRPLKNNHLRAWQTPVLATFSQKPLTDAGIWVTAWFSSLAPTRLTCAGGFRVFCALSGLSVLCWGVGGPGGGRLNGLVCGFLDLAYSTCLWSPLWFLCLVNTCLRLRSQKLNNNFLRVGSHNMNKE